MIAHLERIPFPTAAIRVGPAGFQYGDRYEAFAVLVYSDPPEIVGLRQTPTPSMWRALAGALGAAGLDGAFFRRIDPVTRAERHRGWIKARR